MNVMDRDDTIAAISTPFGEGGIGIIRVTGPQALEKSLKIFRPKSKYKELISHRLYLGYIIDPEGEDIIDECLLVYMKAPRSFTKEEVVEVQCHGGTLVLQSVMELLLRLGIREAGPGEFTKRAFLNGRIDLSQAEAVIDIIRAKTQNGLKLAQRNLKGGLKEALSESRDNLIHALAIIEAYIDFPEEEIEESVLSESMEKLKFSLDSIIELLETYEEGRIYREGIHVVIAGKPNVGKSSLLNALLKEKRAIVTSLPGTTRDVIEEIINIRGIPVNLIDTAGIRETDDIIEGEGIRRTKEKLEDADIVLYMVDEGGFSGYDQEINGEIGRQAKMVVINKTDNMTKENVAEIKCDAGETTVIPVSTLQGTGLEDLKDALYDALIKHGTDNSSGAVISRKRHKIALEKAKKLLKLAIEGIEQKRPLELITLDIREALEKIGEVAGETTTEEILDRIFSEFCIGK